MFAVFAYKTKISVILKSDSKKMYCEAKRSGSDRERKYFPIQQGLILKFPFKPEKLPGLSRNRPPIGITKKRIQSRTGSTYSQNLPEGIKF